MTELDKLLDAAILTVAWSLQVGSILFKFGIHLSLFKYFTFLLSRILMNRVAYFPMLTLAD